MYQLYVCWTYFQYRQPFKGLSRSGQKEMSYGSASPSHRHTRIFKWICALAFCRWWALFPKVKNKHLCIFSCSQRWATQAYWTRCRRWEHPNVALYYVNARSRVWYIITSVEIPCPQENSWFSIQVPPFLVRRQLLPVRFGQWALLHLGGVEAGSQRLSLMTAPWIVTLLSPNTLFDSCLAAQLWLPPKQVVCSSTVTQKTPKAVMIPKNALCLQWRKPQPATPLTWDIKGQSNTSIGIKSMNHCST